MPVGQRRLAAILAADVVGYSRLMGADEESTVQTLQVHRNEVIDPLLKTYNGRVANTAGDSLLIEFSSAVDALRCAIEVQKEIAARNSEIPDDRRQVFRMGINVGDVISQGDDLLGDGVNVAARLESLAPPGGVCISHTVRDQVRDRIDVALEDLGEVEVKNIARAIHAFRVRDTGEISVAATTSSSPGRRYGIVAAVVLFIAAGVGTWWWSERLSSPPATAAQTAKVSIAVLPFENLSDDKKQAYFARGVIEDITTDLSKVPGLHVPSGSATRRYANRRVAAQQVGQELGVRYVLEGSIQTAGSRIRLTAKLIDVETGRQLWAERYDRSTEDVFAVQDEIANHVVAKLSQNLEATSLRRKPRTYTPNLEAYDLYVQGRAKRIPPTPANLAAALKLFEKAIALDPNFAGGYAGAAYLYVLRYESPNVDGGSSDRDLKTAVRLAEKAVELDPEFGPAWGSLAWAWGRERRFEQAIEAIRTAIEKAPNDSLMRATYGWLLGHTGRPQEGIEQVRHAMRMSPDSLPMLYFLGALYRVAGDFEKAIEALVEHRRRLGGRILPSPTSQLIAAYVQAGRLDQARAEISTLLKVAPKFSVSLAARTHVYKDADIQAAFADALQKAGLPD